MSEQIRVLVVDDDALVRAGLTMLLAGAEDVKVVGEAADGDHLGQQLGGVLVAGLVSERHRPAQPEGRGVLVACGATAVRADGR